MKSYCTAIALYLALGSVLATAHEQILPDTTVLAFSTNDFAVFKNQFSETKLHSYIHHPAIKRTWKTPIDSSSNPVLTVLANGELAESSNVKVTFAVIKQNSNLGFLSLISFQTEDEAKAGFERLSSTWNASPTGSTEHLKTATFPKTNQQIWIRRHESTLAITNAAPLVPSFDGGTGKPLADSKRFKKTVLAIDNQDTKGNFWFYVDPIAIATTQQLESNSFLAIALNEGIDSIKAFGCRGTFHDNVRREFVVTGQLFAEQPFARGMRLLNLGILPQVPTWRFHESTIAVGCVALKMNKLLSNVSTIFDTTIGEGEEGLFEAVLDDLKNDPGGPRIDVEKEIISSLDTRMWFTTAVENNKSTTVFSIPTNNREQLVDAITRFYNGDEQAQLLPGDSPAWRIEPLDVVNSGNRDPYVVAINGDFLEVAPTMSAMNGFGRNTRTNSKSVKVKPNDQSCFSVVLDPQQLLKRQHDRIGNSDDLSLKKLLEKVDIQLNIDKSKWPKFDSLNLNFERKMMIDAEANTDGWSVTIEPTRK